jgi:hypothetical protein
MAEPSGREFARVLKVMEQWHKDDTTLVVVGAMRFLGTFDQAIVFRLTGKIVVFEDCGIVKSERGSFVFLPEITKRTATVRVQRSWKGALIAVRFPNAVYAFADYEIDPKTMSWR